MSHLRRSVKARDGYVLVVAPSLLISGTFEHRYGMDERYRKQVDLSAQRSGTHP